MGRSGALEITDLAGRYTEDRMDNFDIYLPLWLVDRPPDLAALARQSAVQQVLSEKSENDKYAKQLRSSRLAWQSLSGSTPTRQTGSKSAALASTSRLRRRHAACVPLSSINRSKSRLCARSLLSGSGWTRGGLTWSCASAVARSYRTRCGVRWPT
jgi:hypothetical protein